MKKNKNKNEVEEFLKTINDETKLEDEIIYDELDFDEKIFSEVF